MNIVQITINTEYMERSIAFYRDVLQMEIEKDLRPEMPIVFLKTDEGGAKIELVENEAQAFRGCGWSFGLHVADVDAERARIRKMGLQPTAIMSPKPGVRFFFIEDPNGITIQII